MKDPYVNEGTDVLKNLGNFTNQDELDEFESSMFKLAFINISKDFYVTCIEDISKLHKIIFSEVYELAGKPRIYKNK